MRKTFGLKNLETASEQEVYSFVRKHLLTQCQPARSDGACVYRTKNGLMCAAGCLMHDEEYKPSYEQNTWNALVCHWDFPSNHKYLIASLQAVHDVYFPDAWEERLNLVAKQFNLKPE